MTDVGVGVGTSTGVAVGVGPVLVTRAQHPKVREATSAITVQGPVTRLKNLDRRGTGKGELINGTSIFYYQ